MASTWGPIWDKTCAGLVCSFLSSVRQARHNAGQGVFASVISVVLYAASLFYLQRQSRIIRERSPGPS
ncbi:hypothetical protein VTK26DRAFT_2012 [Humicola hyalothermophila]